MRGPLFQTKITFFQAVILQPDQSLIIFTFPASQPSRCGWGRENHNHLKNMKFLSIIIFEPWTDTYCCSNHNNVCFDGKLVWRKIFCILKILSAQIGNNYIFGLLFANWQLNVWSTFVQKKNMFYYFASPRLKIWFFDMMLDLYLILPVINRNR